MTEVEELPKRGKRQANGKHNGVDPDQELTPPQAVVYMQERGVQRINTNILTLLRRDGKGPEYLLIDGRWIRYTPRFLDPFIESRKPRLINPAERFGRK
jgi:hypothetical protein